VVFVLLSNVAPVGVNCWVLAFFFLCLSVLLFALSHARPQSDPPFFSRRLRVSLARSPSLSRVRPRVAVSVFVFGQRDANQRGQTESVDPESTTAVCRVLRSHRCSSRYSFILLHSGAPCFSWAGCIVRNLSASVLR